MDKIAMVKAAEVRGVLACLVDNEMVKVGNEAEFEEVAAAVAEELGDEYTLEDVLEGTAEVMEAIEALENMSDEELAELEAAIAAEEGAPAEEEVLEEVPEEEKVASDKGHEKTAELKQQYTDLVMAKEAGEISENYFEKEANKIMDLLRAAGGAARSAPGRAGAAAKAAPGQVRDAARAAPGQVRDAARAAPAAARRGGEALKDGLTFDRLRAARRSKGSPEFRQALRRQGYRQSGLAYGGAGAAGGGGGYAASRRGE